ncbi:hypothetical protein FIBSPDRAFT_949272 [Athelia psychrophila]|uniref:Uncharacterized protein n=1 Tax=Athelia psychrophila TaxID=1759441 RepID=A0A166Q2R0_9AGAM|nr:hypothetical protein FIBSPDRAFT_949272 [Fibularhizoctonia sp. CBS 109695]
MPALHGSWSGVTIDTIPNCDRLFAAAQQNDQAFLYVDYCNSVSQIIPVHLRSAGIAELLRRWGVFHQRHGDRRDRLRRENGVLVRLAKKRKVATQDKPSEDPIGYQDKDTPPHNGDAVMHYDEEVVVVPQYEAPTVIPAPEVPAPPPPTIDGAPVYPGVDEPLLIPVVQPWSNWSDPKVIPVDVTNHRLRMDQAPSDIITEGSYPDVADWVALSPRDWPMGVRARINNEPVRILESMRDNALVPWELDIHGWAVLNALAPEGGSPAAEFQRDQFFHTTIFTYAIDKLPLHLSLGLGPLGDCALEHFPFKCDFVTGLIVHGWLRDHGLTTVQPPPSQSRDSQGSHCQSRAR